jgi:hypothetical protein
MKTRFIYTLSDPITNEVKYIGKTNNINRRLKDHISNSSLSELNKKNNWIISLLKNKLVPKIEILDEIVESDIDFYEIFYISLFKSWGFNLTNGTNGGDGYDWTGKKHSKESNLKNKMNSPGRKSVAQFDLEGNLIKKYHSLREAGTETGINKAHISRVCRNIQKTSGGFKWEFIDRITEHIVEKANIRIIKYEKPRIDSRMKKINVYDLCGNLLDMCPSLQKTSKKYNCHTSLIKNCCEKKGYYQTKNLTFRYYGDIFDYIPYKHYRESKCYKIGIYSEEGDLVIDFKSLKEAVLYTKIGKQYISKNCKGNINNGNNKLKGYIFRFIQ